MKEEKQNYCFILDKSFYHPFAHKNKYLSTCKYWEPIYRCSQYGPQLYRCAKTNIVYCPLSSESQLCNCDKIIENC